MLSAVVFSAKQQYPDEDSPLLVVVLQLSKVSRDVTVTSGTVKILLHSFNNFGHSSSAGDGICEHPGRA